MCLVSEIADLADLYVNNRISLIKQEKINSPGVENKYHATTSNRTWENQKSNSLNWRNSKDAGKCEPKFLYKKNYSGSHSTHTTPSCMIDKMVA